MFDYCFEAPDEFLDYIKSLGYNTKTYCRNFDLMFDERVISFVEDRLVKFHGNLIYKGKDSYKFKIGFAGHMQIGEVDTSKQWIIERDRYDMFKISYVSLISNKYGFTILKKE